MQKKPIKVKVKIANKEAEADPIEGNAKVLDEKPKTPLKQSYGVKLDKDGVKEMTKKEIQEEVDRDTQISSGNKTFTQMTINELDGQLTKFIGAVNVIKDKMMSGVHYIEIKGVDKPIITKQGTAWLAAATNMSVVTKEIKEIFKPNEDLIFYQHEATCSWGDTRFVSAMGSANSKEYNQKRKYEDAKSQKTVFDTINDVLQMSQKRARSQAIKEMIAMTDIFEADETNPLANSRKQMGIYTLFYQHFMKHAPKAPTKRKLKNGKMHSYSEKEKLNWQKDYLKSKYFTPAIYNLGLPTYGNWGIKDIEILEQSIPTWWEKYYEMSGTDKDMILDQKEAKKQTEEQTKEKENNE